MMKCACNYCLRAWHMAVKCANPCLVISLPLVVQVLILTSVAKGILPISSRLVAVGEAEEA
jgi:hypothetical protein